MNALTVKGKPIRELDQSSVGYADEMELKDRIRQARLDVKLNQSQLARQCGVDPSAISFLESGKTRTLSGELLLQLAHELNVDATWLLHGKGPKRRSSAPVEPGDTRLPVRRVLFRLSAGVNGYEVEYEDGESEPIFMARRWFEQHRYRPDRLLAIKVSGRSMEPSLYDGDLVIVNLDDTALRDGQVYAANYEGELVIKRLKRDAGAWYLASDSLDKIRFPDKRCSDGCGLIGRIVYRQTEHI